MFRLLFRLVLILGCAFLSLASGSVLRAESPPSGGESSAAPKAPEGKYDVRFKKEDGSEDERVIDVSNPADRHEAHELIDTGRLIELNKAKELNLFKVETDLALWTLVVFLILMVLLYKLAWGPMLQGLKKREESIAGALEAAQRANEEARKMQANLEVQMAEANQRVNALMDETRKAAARTQEEMLAKARAEIAAERERLRRELDTARDQALQDLSNYAARLATDVAARILRRDLNVDDQRRLVDEALGEMHQAAADRNRILTGA